MLAPSTGQTFVLPYDQLVVAVGALNNTHNLKVDTLQHVNFLNSLNGIIASFPQLKIYFFRCQKNPK